MGVTKVADITINHLAGAHFVVEVHGKVQHVVVAEPTECCQRV